MLSSASAANTRRSTRPAQLWREADLQTSPLDTQLALLPRLGAAWRPLAPLVDADTVRTTVSGLAATQLLAGTSRPVGSFTVKTCCALTGSHAFAGRVIAHPRTVELLEHVQVRGPGGRLEEALGAFAEHICATAIGLHASRECLVEDVEVYTGEGDDFDEEATADVGDARTTSSARGTPERFGLAALHARAPALLRALQAAAVAQQPVYLHVLACVPVAADAQAPAAQPGPSGDHAAAAPPRWHFVAVQKAMCFFYEATSAALKTAASSRASALALERPTTPPQHFQPRQMQSVFQAVWLSDADASWYSKLRENKTDAAGGGNAAEVRARFVSFMRSQVCRFLMRGEHLDLLEALLLLLPEVPREERPDLLADMHACFTSDAAALATFAHQSHVLARVLGAATGPAVPETKRAFALGVARRQCGHLATALRLFCASANWADLEPVRAHLLDALRELVDDHDQLTAGVPAARRTLRRLRRTCYAVHHGLADTLISTRTKIKAAVGRIWAATPELEVPVALQPPPARVKVVDVAAERARQRKAKANPASLATEAVLMQYTVDTGLDRALTDALEAACTARLLRGNPMHAVLRRVKAAAQFFELYRESDRAVLSAIVNEVTFSDVRHNIYCCRTKAQSEAAQLYYTSQARWSDVSSSVAMADGGQAAGSDVDAALGGAEGDAAIYGVQPSILLADKRQLHALRQLLGDAMPSRTSTVTKQSRRYESSVHCAFCGDMLLQGRYTSLAALHAAELREDHFIRGPNQDDAIVIHCQHVVQSFLRLHLKSLHIAAGLQMGANRWSARGVQRDQREALGDAVRAVRAGQALQLHAHALVRTGGAPRYLTLTKAFHLVHFASESADGKDAATAWPARTTQLFDSVFFSPAHVQSCIEAETTTVDPLQGWRARKWTNTLAERVRVAHRGGRLLTACKALLLRNLMVGAAARRPDVDALALVPAVGRMLGSAAARLHELGQLGRAIQGVIECGAAEEHKLKVDNKALVAMFHAFRAPAVSALASDEAYNFESIRPTVQGGIYAVVLDVRTQGVLDATSSEVIETVCDYLELVEISLSAQAVEGAPSPLLAGEIEEVVNSAMSVAVKR